MEKRCSNCKHGRQDWRCNNPGCDAITCIEDGWSCWESISADSDVVNHPEHYTSGKYETIDIIKDSVDDFKSYVHGNIIKYILRYKRKGGVQDLKKAQIYLNWLIEEEECKHL